MSKIEVEEKYCPFIIGTSSPTESLRAQDINPILTSGKVEEKQELLKQLIKQIINEPESPRMLLQVLQYVLPSDDQDLKRLLFLYWEAIEKLKPDGSLKDEVVLACNYFRKDLLHPNEFIRGRTLRLLSKMLFRGMLYIYIYIYIRTNGAPTPSYPREPDPPTLIRTQERNNVPIFNLPKIWAANDF